LSDTADFGFPYIDVRDNEEIAFVAFVDLVKAIKGSVIVDDRLKRINNVHLVTDQSNQHLLHLKRYQEYQCSLKVWTLRQDWNVRDILRTISRKQLSGWGITAVDQHVGTRSKLYGGPFWRNKIKKINNKLKKVHNKLKCSQQNKKRNN